ncbi:protein virilizer homolog isoform X1 [Cryptomeria japonica]|uniref:protein virilizer homolog isoform X1 n=2 Tax=Cryptomeria japonica TaxID=3369 RepID=UPI0027D9EC77|nr:protein virilizer homolog isoform X1 [Cryptomeria japonica]
MGRPEPCVLFAQSFVHPHLDEYVDEVRFTEPVVISACEFLEQNASASCPMISLSGASFPQSFALEAFVQCEGDARFRRLCQAFLYSPSSSNILEVQPVVTNHLVIRGSYRTLTLVVYGNTAEELGQFSVEFDLDNSLANLVRSHAEGKIEDLPLALQSFKPTFEESISSVKRLHLNIKPQPSIEVKEILNLGIKILQTCVDETSAQTLTGSLLLAVSPYLLHEFSAVAGNDKHNDIMQYNVKSHRQFSTNLVKVKIELLDLYRKLGSKTNDMQSGISEHFELDDHMQPVTEGLVLDIFQQCFQFDKDLVSDGISINSQISKLVAGLSMVHLLCTDTEGCCQFVKAGGMQYLINVLQHDLGRSTSTTLLALGVVEHACRYAVGCEAFLGWVRRKGESVPTGTSEGYSTLLKLLLQRPRHSVACLVTKLLHRLRAYEIMVKFESTVGSLLENLSANSKVSESGIKALVEANSEIKRLLKLLNLREPTEDPSPVAHAKRLLLDQDDDVLPYKTTVGLIGSSKYCVAQRDMDSYLLSLLKERCFLPLLAALLSSPSLRSGTGYTLDIFVDLVTTIEAILLSLLLCRSGLLFFVSEPEATAALVVALQGVEDINREEFLSLRYAAVMISKGFFCPPQDIGMIVETNLRVVSAIDRLIGAALHSEELLWALWDLCSISRSDIGRQAVLAIGFFPEAISVLMTVLQSGKESESLNANSVSGTSPLSLAIFHASAELFEVMVNDSTACSMNTWIPHAVDLHKALHSSSPGSNKKDAPTRLLERVDAAVVYHKKGAIGLLRYAAVLASGGDAQLTSTSFLISDPMEIENIAAVDSGGSADFQSVESILGKLVTDKLFDGVILRDSSVPPLTTAMRILSFLAEHPGIAAVLYEEGAVTVVYVIIRNCAMMLERSSNTYDYLVDEGAECNSTADLLLERSQEQYLIDMLFPSLILLLTVLRKLQEAAEQHHNTKLLNALLQLHREISPKLAARTAVLPFCFASSTLALGGVCHLLVSCVACWPIFGWTPGLFQRLLENAPAPASLALGPKEACSVLYMLGELFPEEGIWLWKNGTSSLNALKTLGVGTLLGIKSIEDIDWYLQPHQFEKTLSRLLPHLDKISQIVLHFACAALVVLQDTLRVLVIRISCQKPDSGAVLLRPLLCWVQDHINNGVTISETDAFKGERLLEFLAGLLEHPFTKKILMSEGLLDILISALDKIIESSIIGEKLSMENRVSVNDESSLWMQWCLPLFRSFSFICDPGVSVYPTTVISRRLSDCPSFEGHCTIISRLLKFCIVSKVGKELRACWDVLTSLSSHNLGRSAFAFVSIQMRSSVVGRDTSKESEYVFATTSSEEPSHVASCPLLSCWQKLLAAMENDDHISDEAIEIVRCFAIGILHLCAAGKSSHGLVASRSLFGLECESAESQNEENLKHVLQMIDLLNLKISGVGAEVSLHMLTKLEQTRAAVRSMHCLLEKSMSIVHVPEIVPEIELPSSDLSFSSWELPPHSAIKSEVLLKCISKGSQTSNEDLEELQKGIQRTDESYFFGRLADKFMWECPDSSPDLPTITVPSLKRKAASVDGSNRRQRGDVGSVGGAEATAASSFVRAGGTSVSSSGPSRRDAFRQRKPNTSRPPSMHVDDYVARERNNDGMSSSSNVATVSRAGSTGGRPPSIHVDEFMARQRERQQLVASSGGDLQQPVHTPLPETEGTIDKVSKSRQMKTHLEDDLQEINIELDVVSESDDMLQFPQSDDFLPSAPGGLPGTNSSDSLADDAEFNTGNAPHFIQSTKDTPSNPLEGLNPASGISREPVTQSEGGIQRHGSLTGDKGQINQIVSGETQFHQDQYNNRMQNTRPISSKGYETLSMSKPPETMMQFYDQRNVSGVIQTVAEQGSMSFSALHHGSNQSQPGPGPTLTVSQSHFEQKALAHPPPLPPLPPPPAIPSGSTPQRVETSNLHMSSYMHSARDVQPPLPSGLPFQAYDSVVSGPVASLPGRDQNYTAPKDYYKDGVGSSMNATTAPPLPPTGSHAQLEVPLHQPPPLQFHPEQMRPAGYGSIALSTPPRPLFDSVSGVSTSTTPWVGVPSTARISDENISSSRPPPPLPPMPPPFSAPPVLQASVQGSTVPPVSGMYIQSIPAAPLPPSGSSSDKLFGSFSASSIGQSSVTQSHPLPPAFVPPLPPGRPMSLSGNLSSGVLAQHQGQNQQTQTHHGQQPLQPQPPLQPRQPPQPPQPPRPPPPQPPQQPRPPLQPHQPLEQRPQTHTQGSMHPPHLQYQPQPPSPQQNQPQQTLQQHPHLQQQQAQQPYYSQQPQESHQQQQHDQGEHLLPQYHHQQAEHAQHQNLQQQDSSLRLQQYFSSPESIQALLSDQEKLRQLLEQHPKLMQMLQERL